MSHPVARRVARIIGASVFVGGLALLLWLAYTLWFTGLSTTRAQQEMRQRWTTDVGTPSQPPAKDVRPQASLPRAEPIRLPDTGDAYAVIWFSRSHSSDRPISSDPLFVVEGTSAADLRRGPGHYPGTAAPGGKGNFAVSGHRTTYGAPFGRLHELRSGDRIDVVDRRGQQWIYRVMTQRIVGPDDKWVLGPDPLGTGGRTMTLTTCHPKWSASQRLVVFAELVV